MNIKKQNGERQENFTSSLKLVNAMKRHSAANLVQQIHIVNSFLKLLSSPYGPLVFSSVDWLVGCFGFNGPLRQYFSLYRAVSQREGERGEKGQMREKMSKQPPPAPTASATGPCPTIIQISRTPQHWKFTQHLRTFKCRNGRKHAAFDSILFFNASPELVWNIIQ